MKGGNVSDAVPGDLHDSSDSHNLLSVGQRSEDCQEDRRCQQPSRNACLPVRPNVCGLQRGRQASAGSPGLGDLSLIAIPNLSIAPAASEEHEAIHLV